MGTASRHLPFPHNLLPAWCRYIEAINVHGSIPAAAEALGLAEGTLNTALNKARYRAGVKKTKDLVAMYFRQS